MAGSRIKVDTRDLEKFAKKLENFNESEIDTLMADCVREISGRFIRKVKKKTPVYKRREGEKATHVGGTLRRGWRVMEPIKVSGSMVATIFNPVEYASYVEYGHRKRGGKGWVMGRFMMGRTEEEMQGVAQKVVENRVNAKFSELMK